MVWGQSGTRGIEDLVQRIAANDPKLKSLTVLRQRRLNHEDVASLVRAMASNTNLTELHASSHAFSPQTVALIADMLTSNTSLRSLCIGDRTLGDDGVAALATGVARSSVTRLDLGGKDVGVHGARALANALTAATSLSHLVLASNSRLADAGLRTLCGCDGDDTDATNTGAGSGEEAPLWAGVRVLELQDCGVTAAGIRALAASRNSGRLEVLWLDGNPLGAMGGQALTALLQNAKQLRELHLRGTGLGDDGGQVFAEGLASIARGSDEQAERSTTGCLAHLDLADCGLGPKTLSALCDAFTAGARLAVLSLASNTAVGDADAAGLGACLAAREAAAVAHLDLSGTQAGAQAVAKLSAAPGLRHVSFVGCPFGSPGASTLASSLSAGGWASLEELCVSGCSMRLEDVSSVFNALAAGGAPGLKSLEIGANPATQDDSFPSLLDTLRTTRPEIAVYWRSGDDPAPGVK